MKEVINIFKNKRNLLVLALATLVLLELAWATGYISKPSVTLTSGGTEEQEVTVTPEATLTLFPPSGVYVVGDTFEVQIILEVEEDVVTDGVDLQLLFDPTVLEVLDASSLDFYSQRLTNIVDNEGGVIYLAFAATPDQDEIKGGGMVGTVTFKALQAGEAEVIFAEPIVAAKGINILSQTLDGVYAVN